MGLFGGHIRRNILPRAKDLAPGTLVQDAKAGTDSSAIDPGDTRKESYRIYLF
jgi:hypothetical protein